jgi:hypothetical protein
MNWDPIKIGLAGLKSEIRDFETEMRTEVKAPKAVGRNFNSKLDQDRRLTIIETEIKEMKAVEASRGFHRTAFRW